MGSSTTIDIGRRDLDWRAIAVAGVVQMLVMLVPYFFGVWIWVAAAGPVVGGVIAGWVSRSFEHELNDGAVGAFVGTVLALLGVVALIWIRNPGASADLKLDLMLFFLIFGGFGVLALGTFVGLIGAVVAWVTATARRRSPYLPDRM